MSYKLKYHKISGFFRGEDYDMQASEALSEETRTMLKNILYSYNRALVGIDEADRIPNGLYFLLLEEGAVLFRVGGWKSQVCVNAGMIGYFFEPAYVRTAWFLMDKLLKTLMSGAYGRLGEESVTEAELDVANAGVDFLYEPVNPDGETAIHSFAIGPLDPGLENLVYMPRGTDSVSDAYGRLNLDRILEMEGIYPEALVKESYYSILTEQSREGQTLPFADLLEEAEGNCP